MTIEHLPSPIKPSDARKTLKNSRRQEAIDRFIAIVRIVSAYSESTEDGATPDSKLRQSVYRSILNMAGDGIAALKNGGYAKSVLHDHGYKLDDESLAWVNQYKDWEEEQVNDLVNMIETERSAFKKKTKVKKDTKVKCVSCHAKIGANAFDFEYKRWDKERVEIKRCPICGATIEENYETLDEAELVDESECEYKDGSIVINRDKRQWADRQLKGL